MNGIFRHNVQDPSILFCRRSQSRKSCRGVVEEILDCDKGTVVSSARLWFRSLSYFSRNKFPIFITSPVAQSQWLKKRRKADDELPSVLRRCGLCYDAQTGDMRYGSQRLPAEPICSEMRKVRERRQFGGRKAFRQDRKIRTLLFERVSISHGERSGGEEIRP